MCNAVLEAQRTIDALGHTEVADAAVDPTCTDPGKTAGSHCSVCNEVFVTQEIVEAKGHSFQERRCSVCSAFEPAQEHMIFGDETVFATAYQGDARITSITIEKLTMIPTGAFDGCTNLTTIYFKGLPNNLVEWESLNCAAGYNYEWIYESRYQLCFVTEEGLVFEVSDKEKTFTIVGLAPWFSTEELTIPATLYDGNDTFSAVGIASYAFDGCDILKCIRLFALLTIREYAFRNCTALSDVYMDGYFGWDGSIDAYAFQGCSSLANLHGLEQARYGEWNVHACAFHDTLIYDQWINEEADVFVVGNILLYAKKNISNVYIAPDNIRYVACEAFADCTELKHLYLRDCYYFGLNALDGCSDLFIHGL